MRRKILSLVLALCMVISLLPMTAFAAGDDTTTAETYTVTVKQTGVGEEGSETYGTVKVTGDNITETSSTNGTDTTISSVASGTLLTIEVTAPTGSDGITYAVKEVKAGDNVLKANADGKFTHPVTSDVTIAVTYKQVFAIDVTGAAINGNKVEADVDAAAEGETVTLTVTTAAGYQLTDDSLEVTYTDGEEKTVQLTPANDKYTFTMPAADVTVTAGFEKLSYTITGTGDLTNGSVKATIGSGTEAVTKAEHGDTVKLTVTPNAGYQLNTLKVNGTDVTASVSEGVYTIDTVNANIVVEATFGVKTYAVEIGSITNGTVTANPTNAAKGATVTLTVTPDTGYKLADDSLTVTQKGGSETVTLTAGTTANTYTFTMPEADVTVAATFEAIPYAITTTETGLDADENGTINITGTSVTTGDDDATTATVGNEITVAITAPTGKAVKSVTSADATVKVGATEKESENWKTTCTFTMPAKDVALEIAYETAGAYGVSVGTITGSGTVSTDKYTADKGATVTLTATPDAGYKLTALTVTPESGSGAVTLTPAEIAETGGEYTFTMPEANVTVTATFTAIDYTVTVDTESIQHGTVSASPTTANVGTTITLTVTPDENYEFGTLTVKDAGGNTIATTGSGTSYTFTMPANNVTVTATFVEAGSETPDPEPNPGGNGGGSGGGSTTPTPPPVEPDPNPPSTGEDVTQTVTPDISEGTASATVDKETADKLVSDAVDNKSENVTVKVDVPADADVNEVKADIPASAVADLASKTNAALTVDTPVGNVTIPNKTLAQLGGTSGNVTVTAAVNEDNSVKVEVQANGSTVGTLNGGMKVDLPVSQPTAGTVAVLVDAEGNETILPKSAVDGSEVAVLLENGSATIKFVDNAQSFADTDNHWAKNSIAFVSSRNLFQGMENNNFKADVPMNRAMLVTVLHRLESTPAASGSSFDDVPSDSYYATAAAWAAGKGIVTGDDSGFSGDRSVTREEMAVMLYRYVQTINGNKGTLGSYSGMGGANDVSGWASEAMRWAVGSGIIGGDNSGNLNPGSTATRGEVSQMLMNFVKLITK